MPIIQNVMNQRIVILIKGGKRLDLLAGEPAFVSQEEFTSSHLQELLAKKDIILLPEDYPIGKVVPRPSQKRSKKL